MDALSLALGEISLYWRMTDQAREDNVVPDFVPFEFSFIEELQLFIQKRNSATLEYLERIYQEHYNVGYLQEGHDLAMGYGLEFLSFLNEALKENTPHSCEIAEVGSGGNYILKKLKEQGFNVTAIDPSPIAKLTGDEYGIPVISSFYPTPEPLPSFDMILHYDVLEHIADPVDFLKQHQKDLKPQGVIAFAVPDCSPYIACGDISMLLHEHLNYFDEESLRATVEKAGFQVLALKASNYGSVLFCLATPVLNYQGSSVIKGGHEKFQTFKNKAQYLIESLKTFTEPIMKNPEHSLGFYVALRATPYLSMFQIHQGVRFFDDDKGVHGKYFDGFQMPVENFADFVQNPPSHVIITSFAFGEKIKDKILSSIPVEKITLKTLADFQLP